MTKKVMTEKVMTEKVIMNNLYENVIENLEKTYKELYSNSEWKLNSDNYSQAIENFYKTLNEDQKKDFFILVNQISTDTISHVFGILDGSSSSDIDEEFRLIDENNKEYEFLQDSFLEVVEENQNK